MKQKDIQDPVELPRHLIYTCSVKKLIIQELDLDDR